jgi:TolA-binding protein
MTMNIKPTPNRMSEKMKMSGLCKWSLLLAALLLVATEGFGAYVEMMDGTRRDGTQIRVNAQGDIELLTPQGRLTLTRSQIRAAVADEPPDFRKARDLCQARKWDEAIPILEGIVKTYRYLSWDIQAGRLLGRAQVMKGNPAAAVKVYEGIFSTYPTERQVPETLWGWRDAMLQAGQFGPLLKQLDVIAAEGSRSDAARAQIMRGDIQIKQNNVEPALLDYLRTAILFQDVTDPSIQGEACFKAAQALEVLKDPRAKDMYRKVVTDYPASPLAAQARSKM